MSSIQCSRTQIARRVSDELVEHGVIAVIGQINGLLVGHDFCIFMGEPAHSEVSIQCRLGRVGVFNLDDVSIVVGVGVMPQIVCKADLVCMVSETFIVPLCGVIEIQFFGKQRRPPRADAAKTQHPASVDGAEVKHLAGQDIPLLLG